MTDDEYRQRLAAVEAYFNQRAWRYGGRGDLYLPDAQEMLFWISHCIDADYCGEPRPQPQMTPGLRAQARAILTEFDRLWRDHA